MIHRRNSFRVLVLILPLSAAPATAGAADHDTTPLFADDTLLEVTIDAPFEVLMDVRPDKAELKGSFSYNESDGTARRFDVKLRTRGNYRRAKEHCDFAPIRLNFRKSELHGTLFDRQDKLKLVTHCRAFEDDYQELVFREYLAYRLFRELSDISYGVRLMRVTYFDTQNEKELTRFGFVIEDDKDVAKRNDLNLVKSRFLQHEYHDQQRQSLVHVFEYMIGNTEYSLVNPEPGKNCCHNADILSSTDTPPYIALPFDFDFSGLVNAPYAQPNPKYPIQSVRTRYYKGLCANNDLLPETLALFRDKRDELFSAIEELRGYSAAASRTARSARNYIEAFYRIIDDPKKVEERMLGKCLQPEPVDEETS